MQVVLWVCIMAVSVSASESSPQWKNLTQRSVETGKDAVLAFTSEEHEVSNPGALSAGAITKLTRKILLDIRKVGDKSLTDLPKDAIGIQGAEPSVPAVLILSDLQRVENRIKSHFIEELPVAIQSELEQSTKEKAGPSSAFDKLTGAVSQLGHGIVTELPRFFLLDKHSETSEAKQATVDGCGEPSSLTWTIHNSNASIGIFVVVAVYMVLSVIAVPVRLNCGRGKLLSNLWPRV